VPEPDPPLQLVQEILDGVSRGGPVDARPTRLTPRLGSSALARSRFRCQPGAFSALCGAKIAIFVSGYRRAVPEGHTVHRLAARHRELFAGRRTRASSPQGRFEAGAKSVDGLVFRDATAHGKHLLHHYPGGRAVHVHLGLYGKFSDGPGTAPPPIGEIRLRMTTRAHWLDLRGPAVCELLDPAGVQTLLARLGPDPLRADADPARAYARISRSAKAIAALLLDQSVVAGAGLIFALEVLFRAGVAPSRPGRDIDPETFAGIWADLCALMAEAAQRGRIDTVHSAHTPEAMRRAPRVDRHGGEVYVYRRGDQPCLVCATPVRRSSLAARNSYWCDVCQV
jgi:endonuclease VIII